MKYRITCLERSSPIDGVLDDNHPGVAAKEFARRHEAELPGNGPWRFRVVDEDGGETQWTVQRAMVSKLIYDRVD